MKFFVLAVIFLISGAFSAARAQVVRLNASLALNYERRGHDFLLTAPDAFPLTLTVAKEGIVTCNTDPTDGLEGIEIYNSNALNVTGGVIASEGKFKGGVHLYDTSQATVGSGSVNSIMQRGYSVSYLTGGNTGEIVLREHSFSYLFGGSLSLVSLYDRAMYSANYGYLTGNIRIFGGSFYIYGTDVRLSRPRNAVVDGVRGVSYALTGILSAGGAVRANVFIAGASVADRTAGNRLLANDVPLVVQASVPEAPTGALTAFGFFALMLVRGSRQLFSTRHHASDARQIGDNFHLA